MVIMSMDMFQNVELIHMYIDQIEVEFLLNVSRQIVDIIDVHLFLLFGRRVS